VEVDINAMFDNYSEYLVVPLDKRFRLLIKRFCGIDSIHCREGLSDKLRYFTFSTEFILIKFFCEGLSKSYAVFDLYTMYLAAFAH
jgi:hypothetical protein